MRRSELLRRYQKSHIVFLLLDLVLVALLLCHVSVAFICFWPPRSLGEQGHGPGSAAPRMARDTMLLPEMGNVLSRPRAASYIGQLQGQLVQTNKEGWGEWVGSFLKSRTGRARANTGAMRHGGSQRVGKLLVEVLRARGLDPDKSFDPYVMLTPMPGGSPQKTMWVEEGGAFPVWNVEHRNQFVFDVDDGAVSLEVEVSTLPAYL